MGHTAVIILDSFEIFEPTYHGFKKVMEQPVISSAISKHRDN